MTKRWHDYLLDLFTPETWSAFREKGAAVSGFREGQKRLANEKVHKGDIFLCYLTRVSRWCGVLQVESEVYTDDAPLFDDPDPFTYRFKVKPIVLLDPELAIPVRDDEVWSTLSITKQLDKKGSHWTGFFRASLNKFSDSDGSYLVELLKRQQASPKSYPLTQKDKRNLVGRRKIRTLDGEVEVEVPESDEDDTTTESTPLGAIAVTDNRESIQVQAKVAQIGAEMGFHIWVPKSDKARVLEHIPIGMHERFLNQLPLNYDDTTLRTIEQIDVLWLKGRSMARAFEIEHSTAIYSGLLRMADLLALQPNMDIRLHIVAPIEKRARVLRQIRRPVFSLLDRGPLYDQCSYLSYDSIDSLGNTQHLAHMSHTIVAEYEETAEV